MATLKQLQDELAEVKDQQASKNSGGDPTATATEKKVSPNKPCMYSDRDVAAIASKLQLIIQGPLGNNEEAVKEIVSELHGKYKYRIVPVGTKSGKVVSKIMLEFEDKDARNMCRWELIDQDNNYQATTSFNGKDVEVKLPRPAFEIARDDRLYQKGKIAAMTKKLSFDVCKVNRDLRIVMLPNGEIIASQDKTTWEATLGPPH